MEYQQNNSRNLSITSRELIEVSKLTSEAEYVLTDLKSVKKVIESKTDKVFTLDALKELDAKITEIRTKIISTK